MSQLNINNYNYDPEVDEKLLLQIRDGNNAALEQLINKYKNFVRSKAKTYFLVGADKEDIVQEGMIGLFKAIRDFKDDKMVSFKSFAEICVTRQIITAIKTATRQKHMPIPRIKAPKMPNRIKVMFFKLTLMAGFSSMCRQTKYVINPKTKPTQPNTMPS